MIESLWVYHCGYLRVPRSLLMRGDTSPYDLVNMPLMALAARHSELGVVLVDAPYGHEGPKNVGGMLGALLNSSVMTFRPEWSIVPRLEQIGLRASQVEHVLMTHLHYDHTGGMKEISHATFHLNAKEWRAATTLSPLDALLKGYAVSDYRALHAKMEGLKLPERYDRRDQGLDLFGDGSVRAFSLPGHTIGHAGYLFTLRDGRRFFHVGDAAYDTRFISERHAQGALARVASFDLTEAHFTLSELQRYHDEEPEVEFICSHDLALGERCLENPIEL